MEKLYKKWTYRLTDTYNTNNMINDIETKMLLENIDIVRIDLQGNFVYDEIVYAGFMPMSLSVNYFDDIDNDVIIAHFIEKMPIDDQNQWFSDNIIDLYNNQNADYPYYSNYLYANLNGWKEFTKKNAIAFPMLLYFKDYIYSSNRPINDMSMFRQVTSITYNPRNIRPNNKYTMNILINNGIRVQAIPVTRYAQGKSKGLFFDAKDDETFCGTFYYYEPESLTYLSYNTIRIYRNKFEAIKKLYNEFNITDKVEPPSFSKSELLDNYYNHPKLLPPDLKMTINQFFYPNEKEAVSFSQHKHYMGYSAGLYALEDKYDQAICNVGNKNGIDIIILTHMIGRFQIVTEILDTRIRQESLSNLIYPSRIN